MFLTLRPPVVNQSPMSKGLPQEFRGRDEARNEEQVQTRQSPFLAARFVLVDRSRLKLGQDQRFVSAKLPL